MRWTAMIIALLVPASVLAFDHAIGYAPTNFNPNTLPPVLPNEASIRADLQLLYDEGFRDLYTYASDGTLNQIPRIAKEVGFHWVIMGIWCPANTQEVDSAVAQASYADAYCINNEGLPNGYDYCSYDTTSLAACMDYVRSRTHRLVTTTEQIDDYLNASPLASWLLRHGDWLFPNCHPYWAGITDPSEATAYVQQKYDQLRDLTDKEIVIKETGWPSAGCPTCTEENQRLFWVLLSPYSLHFCYFEAFDQYWKDWGPVEPHWGFNDRYRNPKLIGTEFQNIPPAEAPSPSQSSILAQNYPNPFNPSTSISFGLAAPAHVSIKIYDTAGRLVRVLLETYRSEGQYTEAWDGRDSGGRAVASGIYFCRLTVGSFEETRKMALMR